MTSRNLLRRTGRHRDVADFFARSLCWHVQCGGECLLLERKRQPDDARRTDCGDQLRCRFIRTVGHDGHVAKLLAQCSAEFAPVRRIGYIADQQSGRTRRRLNDGAHEGSVIDKHGLEVKRLEGSPDLLCAFCIAVIHNRALQRTDLDSSRVAQIHVMPPTVLVCESSF